jgi:hypothetical protein
MAMKNIRETRAFIVLEDEHYGAILMERKQDGLTRPWRRTHLRDTPRDEVDVMTNYEIEEHAETFFSPVQDVK